MIYSTLIVIVTACNSLFCFVFVLDVVCAVLFFVFLGWEGVLWRALSNLIVLSELVS